MLLHEWTTSQGTVLIDGFERLEKARTQYPPEFPERNTAQVTDFVPVRLMSDF